MPFCRHFGWLPLSDRKIMPMPRVILRDMDYCSGFYCERTSYRYIDPVLDLNLEEADIIVLSIHWGEPSGSTLAHEHRHLQQRYRPSLPKLGRSNPCTHDGSIAGWSAAIKSYYRSQPWEMDALLYSMKMHRDQAAEQEFEAVL